MQAVESYTVDGITVSDETIPTLQKSLTRLGRGASRTAYALTQDMVLKVSNIFPSPDGQSANEIGRWITCFSTDPTLRPKVAGYVAWNPSYTWGIMERAGHTLYEHWHRINGWDVHYEYKSACPHYNSASRSYDLLPKGLTTEFRNLTSDLHEHNISQMPDGRWVLVDYGF